MKAKKVILIVQSILCVVLAVLLATAVISIYREGLAAKAENPLAWIYTGEKVAERFKPIAPLFFLTVGLAVVGLILDVKDENGLKPVKGGKVENKGFPGAKTVRMILLIAAVCFVIAGVFNGSAKDVFGKAVKICTECVGLG
jgi:hypothetical protein